MTRDLQRQLAAAADALAAGDVDRALPALLGAWRASREPRIADLIDLVDGRPAQPVSGRTATARESAWCTLARSRDPFALPRLLATPWPAAVGLGRARMACLEALDDDPRLARFLVELIRARPHRYASGNDVYERAVALLARLADRRHDVASIPLLLQTPALERALAGPSLRMTKPQRSELARAEASAAERRAKVTHGAARESELLAAIYAEPADLAPRAVYADLLAERADPRAELIALQLAGRDAKRTRRIEALLGRHAVRFAEPLAAYFDRDSYLFEGGFLCGGRLVVEPAEPDPAWRLVHTLVCSDLVPPFALVPFLENLEASGATASAVASSGPATITTLRVRGLEDAAPEVLARCNALPDLRCLGVYPWATDAAPAWLPTAPVVERLERLELGHHGAVVPIVRRLMRRRGSLRELCVRPEPLSWQATFRRDADAAAYASVTIEPVRADEYPFIRADVLTQLLEEVIASTPASRRIELAIDPAPARWRKRLDGVLERFADVT